MKNKISRRQFLQVAGASAAALLLASCSGNSASSVSSSSVASSEAASSAAASSEDTSTVTATGKTLVVYFSATGTTHIETVCALSKLDVYQKITVDLKMDELDVTAAETKATYEEIREYVKEHTGLNVSDLYIAQVKQKCGIKERQNYNKPKAENPKRLKCPAEKERAIREALKYFKMI